MHFQSWEHTLHLQWDLHAIIHETCTLFFLLIIKTHSSWVQKCMLLTYEWCMFSECSGFPIQMISSATSANLWNQLFHSLEINTDTQNVLNWNAIVVDHFYIAGAGIIQWLEHWTHDWKVPGSNPCRCIGRIFFSRVNFLWWLLF